MKTELTQFTEWKNGSGASLLRASLLLILLILSTSSVSAGTGAWIFGTNVFANTIGSGGVEINFRPMSNRIVLPNGALMRTYPVTIITSNNSGSIGSNYFVAGPYKVSTPETADTFYLTVPSDEGAYDWVTLSTNTFNFVVTPGGVRGVAAGTNVTTQTNAGVVTVNASGGGSGGSATNAVRNIYSNNTAVATSVTEFGTTNGPGNVSFVWGMFSGRPTLYASLDPAVTNTVTTNLVARVTTATNDVTTNLVARIATATNDVTTNLVARITTATNDVTTNLVARVTTATNDVTTNLVGRITTATNDVTTNLVALLANGGSATNAISAVKTNNVAVISVGARTLETTNSGNVDFTAEAIGGTTAKLSASIRPAVTNDVTTNMVARIATATNDVTTNLVARINTATNDVTTNLVARINTATNDVTTNLFARITTSTNDVTTNLVARITTATNDVTTNLVARVTTATNDVTTNLVARINTATNDVTTNLVARFSGTGSTNAITNAAVSVASGAIPKLTDRVTATASGMNVDANTNLTGASSLTVQRGLTNAGTEPIESVGGFRAAAPLGVPTQVIMPSTNGNGNEVIWQQSAIVHSNLVLLMPTNGFNGIIDPVMVVTNVTGTGGNHTGQLSWVSLSTLGGSGTTRQILGTNGVTLSSSNSTITFLSSDLRPGANISLVTNSAGYITIAVTGISGGLDSSANSLTATQGVYELTRTLASDSSTNLLIDYGLAKHFVVILVTNTHLVITNLRDGIIGSSLVIHQDTNGTRSITSLRVAGGSLITNSTILNIDTNANAQTRWLLSSFQITNAVIGNGLPDIVNATTVNASGSITGGTVIATSAKITGTATGALFQATAMQVFGGASATQAFVGGMYYFDINPYTNMGATAATFTNMATIPIPANMLTNNGDVIRLRWEGQEATAIATTNNFQIVVGIGATGSGGVTVLDTGLQFTSNGAWFAECLLMRRGSSSIRVTPMFDWNRSLGRPFPYTNDSTVLALDCGTNNTFTLRSGSRKTFAITNDSAWAHYMPAPH